MIKLVKTQNPIHIGYTDTKLPKDLGKQVSKSKYKLKGLVSDCHPKFFKALQDFDQVELNKTKK